MGFGKRYDGYPSAAEVAPSSEGRRDSEAYRREDWRKFLRRRWARFIAELADLDADDVAATGHRLRAELDRLPTGEEVRAEVERTKAPDAAGGGRPGRNVA